MIDDNEANPRDDVAPRSSIQKTDSYIRDTTQSEKEEAHVNEWMLVAMVLDRIFLIAFLITALASITYVFGSAPSRDE